MADILSWFMKKASICLVIMIFGMTLMSSNFCNSAGSDNADLNFICRHLSDSVQSIIVDKPAIVYTCGHNAHVWSVIVKRDDGYKVLAGRVSPEGVNKIYDSKESNMFDTVALMTKYKPLMAWAIDSLPLQAQLMKSINKYEYNPLHPSLNVIPYGSELSYHSDVDVVFAGPDSVEFNRKINALSALMVWLAEPLFRPYSSDSVYIR